ncbi:MAG: molybdate ABC transporter substrate-binding protein [Sulfitobacter sp.]
MIKIATIALSIFCLGAAARAETVIFAAASLRGVLEEVFAGQEDLRIAYGGSGVMARQVAAGAPADAILLAHPQWAAWLVTQGRVEAGAVQEFAANSMVLVARAGSDIPDFGTGVTAADLQAALGGGRFAMGQRGAVPAGRYAMQWLQHLGAWETLAAQLAETDDVRAALALVALGAAPLGAVYRSDAAAEPRVRIVAQAGPGAHDKVRYVGAGLNPAGQAALAQVQAAGDVFARHGFGAP